MTRVRRQKWDSSHERARARAAERLWEVLGAGEAEWLDRHLTECPDCRAVADSYDAQRIELRGLRDRPPVPPRDLWARTAAAIEREDARRRPSLRPDPAPRIPLLRRKRPSPVPLGAMAGLLVVAVVVGVSLLGGRQTPRVTPSSPLTAETRPPVPTIGPNVTPAGTPIVVAAGDVGWMRYGPDGRFDVFFSPIDEVCADAQGPDCAPIDEASPRSGQVQDAPPQTVVMSPDDKTLVVVDGAGKVVVVPVPTAPGSTPQPTASPQITPAPPVETPQPPAETPTPPIETPPAESPDPSASPEVTATPTPIETATPTVPGGPIEIISDVIVVGQAAAYSPDGTWFAFSARPADGTQGPDIYVWRTGDAEAVAITADHRSVFSGWLGESVLGSRPVLDPTATASPPPADAAVRPMAFLLDPSTSAETALDAAPFWRPSVSPTGSWAIYWDGTLTLADNGFEWRPGNGALVLGVWPPVPAPATEPPASEPPASAPPPSETPASEAPASESPAGSVDPSAAPPSGSADGSVPPSSPSPEPTATAQVIDSNPIRDWDARWDETGSHVAIWIADQTDPTIGRLSLYVVDPATGTIDLANPLLSSQPALPGFSITSDRLAWATPDNQDGEGSHVEVLAWTKDDSGQVQSAPGEEQVVVIR